MTFLLWIVAIAMVLFGVVSLLHGAAGVGTGLIAAAVLVGPGGSRLLHV